MFPDTCFYFFEKFLDYFQRFLLLLKNWFQAKAPKASFQQKPWLLKYKQNQNRNTPTEVSPKYLWRVGRPPGCELPIILPSVVTTSIILVPLPSFGFLDSSNIPTRNRLWLLLYMREHALPFLKLYFSCNFLPKDFAFILLLLCNARSVKVYFDQDF